ncbi:hypothetical protein [Methanoplanus endosymbiosus]|uniref:Uncharacterized protein n=1 Tax=Methanoplanus endosymbiosus TaxID=33865 RepID=A0A9E7PT16_9EURY|nr:hypothetical protein [Methanoplanus endosymbiosus]UUX93307.1 hypothetical protein L6E24_04055 [Methanoplanus endosymbiosus]
MNTNKRRIAVTAGLAVVAVVVALIAVFLSGAKPGADIIGISLVIILAIITVAIIKTVEKKNILYICLIIGILMLVAGSALAMIPASKDSSGSFSAMAIMGLIMVIIAGVSLRKPADYNLRDERSLKIGTWAISYSWYLAYLLVILMFWLSFFEVVALSAEIVLGVLMFLMPLSAVVFQCYFSKKEDVY